MRKISFLVSNSRNLGPAALCAALVLIPLMMTSPTSGAEDERMAKQMVDKRWPGYAILGNGTICAVYSDHPGPFPKSTLRGIQHLYYRDFTADYIASTSFELLDEAMDPLSPKEPRADSVAMENFYTTLTQTPLPDGGQAETRAFAHPSDAIILSFKAGNNLLHRSYRFRARLLRRILTDRTIRLDQSAIAEGGASFSWSNGTALAVGIHSGDGWTTLNDMGLEILGPMKDDPILVIIAAGSSQEEALEKLTAIRAEPDPAVTAAAHWKTWWEKGIAPSFKDLILLEAYRRNLYAARAACLGGQIPADITGQFRTQNMPQLYPRDALMSARVFLLAGHVELARQVLAFWADPNIPSKSPGEWYARYNAHGQAVDAGSGARYDEPEWDSNGYLIQLSQAYHDRTGRWPVEASFLFQLGDFLVDHIDDNGLLFEGGIVEWSGYLPATNMIAAAALKTASRIAREAGDPGREERYRQAWERISSSLPFMFDRERGTYCDVRFAGGKGTGNRSLEQASGEALYLWDTSANFGLLWGYPDHEQMRSSNRFYAENCVQANGGMQYFDAPDAGLSGYGHDLFIFTTAAAAQYQARSGDPVRARAHIDWMLANANVYGLMPERIYLNGTGCSQASPLSWCCAEFCAALLEYSRARP